MAIIGAVGIGVFYIAILYNTYNVTYTKSRRILNLVSVGMATPLALMLFYAFIPMYSITFGSEIIDDLFHSVLTAPIMEESFKLWIFYLVFFRKKPHMGPFEGMFSFAIIGLGFAIVEDCDYIIDVLFTEGDDPGTYAGIMFARSFPGHMLFDGIAGYWIGHAGKEFFEREQQKKTRRFKADTLPEMNWNFIAKGYSIALAAHASWNFILTVTFWLWLTIPLLFFQCYLCVCLYRKYFRASKPPEPEKVEISYHEMLAYHRKVIKENRIAREKDLQYLVLKTIPSILGLSVVCLFADAFIRMFGAMLWG